MCNVGFYNANASQAVDQSLIHAAITSGNVPISMIADVVDCRACHAGADCSTAGTTAAQLPPAPPPAAPSACGMSVGLGIGLRSWPLALAGALGHGPRAMAHGQGVGLCPWPLPAAMAFCQGPGAWPRPWQLMSPSTLEL